MSAPRKGWGGSYMKLQGELQRGRKRAGLTQAQMATQLCVGVATFQRWEDGRADPRAKQLFQWAHILGIEIGSAECINSDVSEAA